MMQGGYLASESGRLEPSSYLCRLSCRHSIRTSSVHFERPCLSDVFAYCSSLQRRIGFEVNVREPLEDLPF